MLMATKVRSGWTGQNALIVDDLEAEAWLDLVAQCSVLRPTRAHIPSISLPDKAGNLGFWADHVG